MFVFEKNPTSKLDKSGKVLIHCSTVVHVPWHTSETMSSSVKLQHYFPIIINIFLYHGHENKQKTKNINFHWRTSGT